MKSRQYIEILDACKQLHQYHGTASSLDAKSWGDGTGFDKVLPWIQDLVEHYDARSMLEVGAGRNLQMAPKTHFNYKTNSYSSFCTVADFLNLNLYTQYDPAVPGIDQWPNSQFDCTILVMVLDNIPVSDFAWWLNEVSSRTLKFCLICEYLSPKFYTTTTPRFLDYDVADLHLQIANNFKGRTSTFYKEILQQHWNGPDLYFLTSPKLPITQSWMSKALLK